MLGQTTRAALLGSVTAFALSGAHAQTTDQAGGDVDMQACITLAERLAEDAAVDAEVRTEVEEVIATGDSAQCQVVFTAWEAEGAITRESLELVATDSVTQRMVVQQEIEVAADVAVYQPPAEVSVDTGTPEIVWTLPRQNVTVDEQAPQITVRQARATVRVEMAQPRVTVMIPEPEITITWPESTFDMSQVEPMIEVRIPEPVVTVNMPDPVVELTIGGDGPANLVALEDGRFAPQGATDEDLQPRITIQQHEATVSAGQAAEAPEITSSRGEPVITYEGQDPEVTVEIVGEPEIRISTAQQDAEAQGTVPDDATAGEQAAGSDGTIPHDAASGEQAAGTQAGQSTEDVAGTEGEDTGEAGQSQVLARD